MINKMKDHLPSIEIERMKSLLDIEEKYEQGKITLEEGRERLRNEVGKIYPYHIAYMEQTLKDGNEDECVRVDMHKVLELLEGFMENKRPELAEDHPLAHYYKENDEMRKLLLKVEDLVQYPLIKNQWLELYDDIKQYPIHYKRKQNQLYPLLEKKGFDRPTTTMWTFDDIISDEIRSSEQLLEATDEEAFIAKQHDLIAHARDLMEKEETILYPTALALITKDEFEDMKIGDQEIGFAFINVTSPKPEPLKNTAAKESFATDLQNLLSKYGYGVGENEELNVTTGKLTLKQINLIYKHLPIDISFVDENELVKFYSDTNHRIFPRSKNVIGREVTNCHPRKSVHIVKEIVDKFRKGEQDYAEFWINKPDVFIYIHYTAVRDEKGKFCGVLEMMQDCTHIRSLTGSQTLLTWAGEEEKSSTSEEKVTTKDVVKGIEITPETKLKDIFEIYPMVKKELAKRYPSFKMLNSPLGKIMLKRATIQLAGERSGLGVDRMIKLIKDIITSL
nr:DUF438 domain-containing protein [uncultured Prevotella sp.]